MQGLALIGADHTHTLVVVRVTEVPAEREEGHDRPTCGRRRVTKLRRTQEDRRDEHAMIRPRACVRANFQIPRRESEHRRDLRAQSKAKQGKGSSKRTVRPFRLLSFVIHVQFQLLSKSHATLPTHQEQWRVPAF